MNGPPINTATMSSTFDEAAELIKLMWTEETPSFEGRYYSIRESCCRPKPVQKPHMPLMVAGDGERLTLRTAARHRDMSNFAHWVGTPETFKHRVEVLERHCMRVVRNPNEIRKTWAAFVFIDEDRVEPRRNPNPYLAASAGRRRPGASLATRRPSLRG